jgi:hypothetical protein
MNNRPGSTYVKVGKFLGFLAIITIPASPLYLPLFCTRAAGTWGCTLDDFWTIYLVIFIAVILAAVSIILLILGRRLNRK